MCVVCRWRSGTFGYVRGWSAVDRANTAAPQPPFAEVSARRCAGTSRRRGSKPLHHGICIIIITSVMPSWAESADTASYSYTRSKYSRDTTIHRERERDSPRENNGRKILYVTLVFFTSTREKKDTTFRRKRYGKDTDYSRNTNVFNGSAFNVAWRRVASEIPVVLYYL